MIDTLIDKQDTFEIIRDKIAQILANESANQQALAVTAGKDPELWKLRVFTERATPWDDGTAGDLIVNVWFNNDSVDQKASDVVQQQTHEGVFNIDVIGFAMSTADGPTGQNPGDEAAALEAARGMRLVRNILMASTYTYLDLRGLVWQRMPRSRDIFQPQLDNRATLNAIGARLALGVKYSEFSPQHTPAVIESIHTTIERGDTGEVLAEVETNFT